MLNMFDLQDFIFEKPLSRKDLLDYQTKLEPNFKISVYRNHSFELIENTIKPYMDYASIGAQFLYSDYDDSLSFLNLDLSSDLIILWLDTSRYSSQNLQSFIAARINALLEKYNKAVLLITLGDDIKIENDRVCNYSLTPLKNNLGTQFLDLRLEAYSGTKLSSKACLEISKDLGLKYIPALLRPNLKGIVVDLDNTLYKGVLGEDGVSGVTLTEAHKNLQQKLKQLSEQGFFLCIASKNDQNDVFRLFEQRSDFPLKASDFTKICAHWDSKAKSLQDIAAFLNINSDSLLFIDDNLGEIVTTREAHPNLNVIWAKDNAIVTLNALNNYPGLLKLNLKKEDFLRKGDVLANQERQHLQQSLTHEEYIKSLDVELSFDVDNFKHSKRVSELANKTNQFIFTYKRYSLQDVEDLMRGPDSTIVTISLKDKLSDSGIIGVMALKKENDVGILDEFFVSCRALGRGMDDAIILGAIKLGMAQLSVNKLRVHFTKGERNLPAENFVNEKLSIYLSEPQSLQFEHPHHLIHLKINSGSQLER